LKVKFRKPTNRKGLAPTRLFFRCLSSVGRAMDWKSMCPVFSWCRKVSERSAFGGWKVLNGPLKWVNANTCTERTLESRMYQLAVGWQTNSVIARGFFWLQEGIEDSWRW